MPASRLRSRFPRAPRLASTPASSKPLGSASCERCCWFRSNKFSRWIAFPAAKMATASANSLVGNFARALPKDDAGRNAASHRPARAPPVSIRSCAVLSDAAGKGLRPAYASAPASLRRRRGECARQSAVSIELFHNAFLVHDDIEDGSEYRRGSRRCTPNTASRSPSMSATR